MEINTLNITPTWAGILPAYMAVLENGNAEGRKIARAEMLRMARLADLGNEACRALRALNAEGALDHSPTGTDELEAAKRAALGVLASLETMRAAEQAAEAEIVRSTREG